MDLVLTPEEVEQFQAALLSAFPFRGDLEQLVYFRLGQEIDQIIPTGGTYANAVTNLIKWANANGKAWGLLSAAHDKNPGNTRLRELFEQIKARVWPLGSMPHLDTGEKDLEALIFGRQRDTRLPFSFAEGAVRTAKSVAQLTVPRIFDGVKQENEVGRGTGWLIAPGIVITNHHVIDSRQPRMGEDPATQPDFKAQAEAVEVLFDYYQKDSRDLIKCNGAQLLANNKQLDYAIIQLVEAGKVADRTELPIVTQPLRLVRGARMNLVQYPGEKPLQYAIRNNFFVRMGDEPQFIRYQTDSELGASGSPVCNDDWQVIGLHHAAVSVAPELVPQETDGQPVTVNFLNEAVSIHSILNDLPTEIRQMVPAAKSQS